jgi:hypothetical protein
MPASTCACNFTTPTSRLLADAALGRRDRMYRAIWETGRNLSWHEVELALRSEGEGRVFEMPSAF